MNSRYLTLVERVAKAIEYAETNDIPFTDESGEINEKLYVILGGYYPEDIEAVIAELVKYGDISIVNDKGKGVKIKMNDVKIIR